MPNTPLGRKRTHTLVERAPGKAPTSPRAAPAPDPSESHYLLPSTAPAVLYKGRGGKERKRTTKPAESKARGYLLESQPVGLVPGCAWGRLCSEPSFMGFFWRKSTAPLATQRQCRFRKSLPRSASRSKYSSANYRLNVNGQERGGRKSENSLCCREL
jgi:hypothetical protein